MIRKTLLGATALVTVTAAGSAFAATAPTLKISGYYNTAIVFGDDGKSDHTNVSFEDNDAKIRFTIEGVADNGLTYGAIIAYRATNNSADRINDNYAYFSGAFGRIEFGSRKGVANNMTYQGPAPDQAKMIGVDTPSYFPQVGAGLKTVTTYNNLSSRSEKLNYYTPRIEGFQLGLTYTPHGCRTGVTNGIGGSGATYNSKATASTCVASGGFESHSDADAQQDFEVALNFSRQFSGVTLNLSGSYAYQQAPGNFTIPATSSSAPVDVSGLKDRQAFSFGGNLAVGVGAGTVTLGGSYLNIDNYAFKDHSGYQAFEGGVAYAQGPWQVGIESVYGDLGNGSGAHNRTLAIGVGGGYQLAQGLTLSAGYLHYSYGLKDGNASTSAPDDANVFLIGTGLSF